MHTNMHTHLIGGDTDVDTSSACAHTTRVSSADNRNNKHKQVVRPYKCMSQCRSNNISGVGNIQNQAWKWEIKQNKMKETSIFLHKRPCRCPQAGGSPSALGTRHTAIPQQQGLCAGRNLEINQQAQVKQERMCR